MHRKFPDLYASNHQVNYTAVALSALRRLPYGLRARLHDLHLWQDVRGAALVAAVESWSLEEGFRDSYNRAQREIYHALRDEGFKREYKNGRVGSFTSTEISFSDFLDEEDEEDKSRDIPANLQRRL